MIGMRTNRFTVPSFRDAPRRHACADAVAICHSEDAAESSSGVGRHKHEDLANLLDGCGVGPSADRLSNCVPLPAIGAVDPDLDESMRRQRAVELRRHGIGKSALPHLHDRLERVGAALEVGAFAGS